MLIKPSDSDVRTLYGYLTACITPRPIAWVSSLSKAGVANLAPYSFFNGISVKPATLMFSSVNNKHGEKKDTVVNIEDTKEFVVNVVTQAQVEVMNQSSAEYPADESEFDKCDIDTRASEIVAPFSVALAPIQMECKLYDIHRIGEGPFASNLVIGEIVMIRINDDILDDKKQIDPNKLDAIGRMGGSFYSRTTDNFSVDKPKI